MDRIEFKLLFWKESQLIEERQYETITASTILGLRQYVLGNLGKFIINDWLLNVDIDDYGTFLLRHKNISDLDQLIDRNSTYRSLGIKNIRQSIDFLNN